MHCWTTLSAVPAAVALAETCRVPPRRMLSFLRQRWFLLALIAALWAGLAWPEAMKPLVRWLPGEALVASVTFIMALPLETARPVDGRAPSWPRVARDVSQQRPRAAARLARQPNAAAGAGNRNDRRHLGAVHPGHRIGLHSPRRR